jgi:sarcosine oxidase subunit delta
MLLIPCPWCGARNEIEFECGGEADRRRPADPAALDAVAWSDYVFNRSNTKGLAEEWWWHAKGCRRWFTLARDTLTHRITRPPEADA